MAASLNDWNMNITYLTFILIVYFTGTGLTFPSKPLNQRRQDYTWEAWLLVDENQNQNRHSVFNSDGTLRRRITPKSVFIAPTFSPESLPACADGYSSDPMGRCIKIIKLDEEAHYDFIIKNLEDKFGSFDYEDEEKGDQTVQTSQGPLQVNIPLGFDKHDNQDDYSEEETDIAIVVSPTKPIVDFKQFSLNKRDNLVDEQKQEMLLKDLIKVSNQPPTTTPSPLETTTYSVEHETYSTTLENQDTTSINSDIPTTDTVVGTVMDEGNTAMSTDMVYDTTTITEGNRFDTTTNDYLTMSAVTDAITAPSTDPVVTDKLTTQSPKPTFLQNDSPMQLTSQESRLEPTTASPKQDSVTTKNTVRFPDQEKSSLNVDKSFVRFPESEFPYQTQIPSTFEGQDVHNFGVPGYYKHKANENPVVFRDNLSTDHTNVDYSDHHDVSNKAVRWEFNRRNRDKNSSVFMLPPKWNPNSFQKPLVLRFSRKHAFMDNNDFKNPAYYRSIPPDDFAYLFKFKQKRIRR